MSLVFVDPLVPGGRVEDDRLPTLRATDLGVTRGEGAFETLLAVVEDRKVRVLQLDDHLERLDESLARLDLRPAERSELLEAMDTAIALESAGEDGAVRDGEFVVRFFVTAGQEPGRTADTPQTSWVTVAPRPEQTRAETENGVRLASLTKGTDAQVAALAPWLLQGVKSISYATNMAAIRHAKSLGADDALFVTSDGFVLEGPTSNLILARGRELVTPDPSLGLLHGTTQRKIFAQAGAAGWKTGYARLTLEDVRAADAVWLTSSVRLFTPILAIDGEPLPSAGRALELGSTMAGWIFGEADDEPRPAVAPHNPGE